MTKTRWDAIEVQLSNRDGGPGKRVRIIVDAVVGAFAIHQRVWAEQPTGPGWTVSHCSSGMSIWTATNYDDAVKVAHHLEKQRTIPEGREAFLAWKDKLTGAERSKLIETLQRIAPRYYAPDAGFSH